MPKKRVNEVISALKSGKICLLIDDATLSPCGYLVQAAEHATEETISKIVCLAKSVICVALPAKRIEELGLFPMSQTSTNASFDFTVSVEAREGVTTGISSADRARTLATVANTDDSKLDLVSPGHIFPIKTKNGGVLVKSSAGEAAVDLMKLADLKQAATISHCLNNEGELLNESELDALSKTEKIPSVRISEIIHNRLIHEPILERAAEASLPTSIAGDFKAICFRSKIDQAEHLVLLKGDIAKTDQNGEQEPILARVQAENKIADLLGVGEFSTRKRIVECLDKIREEGRGIFVYIRHPRKDMLKTQLEKKSDKPSNRAYQSREFGVGAQILASVGAKRIKLISNVEKEIAGLSAFDIEIVQRIPI